MELNGRERGDRKAAGALEREKVLLWLRERAVTQASCWIVTASERGQ